MLILASMSPRRREILTLAGYNFVIKPADIDESVPAGTLARDAVVMIAAKKADAVYDSAEEGDIVLAADTVVCFKGKIIGKPRDQKDAHDILRCLSGDTHTVFTGYCIKKGNKRICGVEATDVTFRTLSDDEITTYIKSGEPMDKAGAYGLQGLGCTFASKINGDYFNVIGLPICKIHEILKEM